MRNPLADPGTIGVSAGGKSASLVVPMLNVLEEDAGNFNDN